jgi:hypothetical protein
MRLDLDEVFKTSERKQKQANEHKDVLKVKHISMNETQMACIIEHQVIMSRGEDTVNHKEKRYS